MRQITVPELQVILRQCAGEDATAQPLQLAADQPFDELGYDSLALMETQARIKQDFGADLPDDAVDQTTTPQQLVDIVNSLLKTA